MFIEHDNIEQALVLTLLQEGAYFNNVMFLGHYPALKPQVITKHLIKYDETLILLSSVFYYTP
jgi:hypothetical protein